MYLNKILVLLVVGLVYINARSIKPKKVKIIPLSKSCGCALPVLESLPICNRQKLFIDDPNRPICSCMETYGVLNAEMPNCARMNAVKLPNMARCECNNVPLARYDANILPVATCDILPAINLPELYECVNTPGLAMSSFVPDLPCAYQAFQYVENACGCKNPAFVEYLVDVPVIAEPCYVQAPKCQQQIINAPSCRCGCQNVPCTCQNMPCSCQNVPCSCQNLSCNCQNVPCSCQKIPCSCQSLPCCCQSTPCSCPRVQCYCQNNLCSCQSIASTCQNMPCSCQTSPCCSQKMPCCCQNVACTCQSVPSLEYPCGCQSCQISAELGVYGIGCQLPPPVIGCGGKYLRQVTIQPPFL